MSRTLFITGASSGIGAATARAAVAEGWQVGLFARSAETLAELERELGPAARAVAGDATSLEDQRAAMDTVSDAFGGIDAVFANAGTGSSGGGTEGGDPAEWETLVRVNVLGVLWTAKAAMPHLTRSKGHLVLTGSAAGRKHIKGSVYSATKWFVHGYGGNLAEEMREFGGRCTVVAPGMVDTPFFDDPKPDKLKPEDIARSVLFALGSDPRANVQEIFVMPVN